MNKLVVIARYQENLNWVNGLEHSILIYNKGNDFPYNFPKIDVPNKGREPETYLRAIIENYHSLKDFSHIAFVQGNPFDHFNENINDKISSFNDTDKVDFICNSYGYMEYGQILHINNFSLEMIKTFLSGSYSNETGAMKCVFLLNFLGIHNPSVYRSFSCGAQYIVPVNFILNKSLEWWKNAYRIYDMYINFNSGDPALLFEIIWTVIWSFEEKKVDTIP